MKNKTQLITPLLMLTAGMIASVIMYVRGFDFNTMLWNLLIVLVIFYIIGDIVRYIYAALRPRTIPASSIDQEMIDALMNGDEVVGNVVAVDDADDAEKGEDSDYGEEGYSDEELDGYDEDDE